MNEFKRICRRYYKRCLLPVLMLTTGEQLVHQPHRTQLEWDTFGSCICDVIRRVSIKHCFIHLHFEFLINYTCPAFATVFYASFWLTDKKGKGNTSSKPKEVKYSHIHYIYRTAMRDTNEN